MESSRMNSIEKRVLNRRTLLGGAATLAAVAGTQLLAQEQEEHQGHQGQPREGDHAQGGANNSALIDAAAHCVRTGQVCVNHCIAVASQDQRYSDLLKCAVAAQELIACCQTYGVLAANNSTHLKAYAEVAMKICQACEAECNKHWEHHMPCKSCAASCASCISETRKLLEA